MYSQKSNNCRQHKAIDIAGIGEGTRHGQYTSTYTGFKKMGKRLRVSVKTNLGYENTSITVIPESKGLSYVVGFLTLRWSCGSQSSSPLMLPFRLVSTCFIETSNVESIMFCWDAVLNQMQKQIKHKLFLLNAYRKLL